MPDEGGGFPLGEPVNRPKPDEGQWVPVNRDNPYFQRHTKTGETRNVRPVPPKKED